MMTLVPRGQEESGQYQEGGFFKSLVRKDEERGGTCGKSFSDASHLPGQPLASGIHWWGRLEKLKEGIQGGASHNVEMVANQNPKTFRQTVSAVRGRDTPRPHSKFTLPGRRGADSCLQQV